MALVRSIPTLAVMKKILIFLALVFTSNSFASTDTEYWSDWHKKSKTASACSSTKSVSVFLKSAISNLGNAERTEANAEVIENLVIEKTNCFNSALSKLSKTDCAQIVKFFIESPIYHDASTIKNKVKRQSCYAS